MKGPIGHMTRVPPRNVWPNEASDFTVWLAEDTNFQVLAETLHFTDAEVEATEKSVGSFSADIIGRDRDGYILVENQLEQTNHTHLGQILTYLAGLDGPVKVVWIATKIREEHRAAIDWLNANSPDEYSFFAVELEVYTIGDSAAAPYFHVAARPNEWTRHLGAQARQLRDTALTETQRKYKEYWTAFADYMDDHDPTFNGGTPPKGSWWSFGIGKTHFSLTVSTSARDHWIRTEVYFHQDEEKLIFDNFHSEKTEIEAEFGELLEWERLEGKGARISTKQRNTNPMQQEKWPEYFAWYAEKMARFRHVFEQRIRDLDLDEMTSVARDVMRERAGDEYLHGEGEVSTEGSQE
jgi:uncharacterized protein DUF4268